jgi:hypothetical protein
MERKVARASGVRSATEQAELHKRIALLEAQAEKEKAQVSMLDKQCKRLNNGARRPPPSPPPPPHPPPPPPPLRPATAEPPPRAAQT